MSKKVFERISQAFPGFFSPDGWVQYADKIATMPDGAPVMQDASGEIVDLRTLKPYNPALKVAFEGDDIKVIEPPPVQPQVTRAPAPVRAPQSAAPRMTQPPTKATPLGAAPAPPPGAAAVVDPNAAKAKLASLVQGFQDTISNGQVAAQAAQVEGAGAPAAPAGGAVDALLDA